MVINMQRIVNALSLGLSVLFTLLFYSASALAINAVNPTGVNVRSNAPNTVFLTFQGLESNEKAVEASWCGTVISGISAGSVSSVDPCVPGTLFGKLPIRFDRARPSVGIAQTNLTDIMVIPESIVRRAVQEGRGGLNSDFFYVRKFTGGSTGDKWVVVTCRLAAGGARTPLSLIDVQVLFSNQPDNTRFYNVRPGDAIAPFHAVIQHNGTGQIKGRWELVRPGDPEPEVSDLLTEASLPVELRALQKRYLTISRFSQFVPPNGIVRIEGPNPSLIDTQIEGGYRILIRIEASDDKEANSEIGSGQVVRSGGVAGFPMPTLNYFVSKLNANEATGAGTPKELRPIGLVLPLKDGRITTSQPLFFDWIVVDNAKNYLIEFFSPNGLVMSAMTELSRYSAPPPWRKDKLSVATTWQVTALDMKGNAIARSELRNVRIEP
jgi:hypothetical protein